MSERPRYRFRSPATGREVIIEAEPGKTYIDRESGEPLEVRGMVVPLPPSRSRLPFAPQFLRFCPHCGQLAQRDLNECPTCSRRMDPVAP